MTNQTIEIKDILTNLGYNLIDQGKQWSTSALFRNGDNKIALTINKDTGLWYDFVTNNSGRLEKLIELTTGVPVDAETISKLKSSEPAQNKYQDVELENVKTFDKNLLIKLEPDHSYWLNRGVSKEIITKFQGGIAKNGRMKNRYTLPIFNEKSDLVGFSGRDLGNSEIKWRHLGKKSTWVYPLLNLDSIIKKGEVILVEGHGDLFALMTNDINNVWVTFGTNISPKVIEYLLRVNPRKIYIGFNNDNKGSFAGNKAAVEAQNKLLKYFDPSQVKIALPEAYNDFGEMPPEEIKKWHSNLTK